MSSRIPIVRPGAFKRKKKEEKRKKMLKTEVSGSSIKISMKSPDLKITTNPDGTRTTCFDLGDHRFVDKR